MKKTNKLVKILSAIIIFGGLTCSALLPLSVAAVPDPAGKPTYDWEVTTNDCGVWSDYIYSDGNALYSLCEHQGDSSYEWLLTKRDLATGELITNFGVGGEVDIIPEESYDNYPYALMADSSGVYIAGSADYHWYAEKRDLTTGELIPGFGVDGIIAGEFEGEIWDLALGGSSIYLVGWDYAGDDSEQWRIEKRDATTGDLITEFGVGGVETENPSDGVDVIYSIVLDSSGLYVGGYDYSVASGGYRWRIEKRNLTTGDLITGFGDDGVVTEDVNEQSYVLNMAINSSGIYLVGRDYDTTDFEYQWRIEKRNLTTGDLITGFGDDGIIAESLYDSTEAMDIALDYYGLYIVGNVGISGVGFESRIEKRDLTTGAFDITFGTEGVEVYDVAINGTNSAYGVTIDNSGIYIIGYVYDEHTFIMKYAFPQDSTPPTFTNLPGLVVPINLAEGQVITTNPYIISVKPADNIEVAYVEFYVDGVLICTDNTVDVNGVYSCAWDTSLYHSDVQVYAYDTSGNRSVALNRTVTVNLGGLPNTGLTTWYYLLGLVPALGIAVIRRRVNIRQCYFW